MSVQETDQGTDPASEPRWYIIKQPDGSCGIQSVAGAAGDQDSQWGPFESQEDAIAKRVGLIRSGKCLPV